MKKLFDAILFAFSAWAAVVVFFVALFVCVLLFGCAPATASRPTPSIETQAVDYVTHIISSYEWEHSQWYRAEDSQVVGFFVVSEIGSICLTSDDGTWVLARHGDPYRCRGGWRGRSNSYGVTGTRVSR